MTHFVYDPPKGDYWAVSYDPIRAQAAWKMLAGVLWADYLAHENYYFWLGKDGEVDACG